MFENKRVLSIGWITVFLVLLTGSCQALPGDQADEPALSPSGATEEPLILTTQGWVGSQLVIRQWAVSAEASSTYVEPEWGPNQATGAPDAPGCGDYQFAWASASNDEIATLELVYKTPVYVSEIIIVQSFNPDQVIKVEILNPDDEYQLVYQKIPVVVDRPCPYSLSVPVGELDFKSDTIRITVDQSVLGLGWNEIDAVRLVGTLTK